MKSFLAAGVALFGAASAMNENGEYLKSLKLQQWEAYREEAAFTRSSFTSTAGQATACVNGKAVVQGTTFPCNNIDFEGFVSLDDMEISSKTNAGSDIWGWLDRNGREITIMCVNNGVWFVDGTNPSNPLILGSIAALSDRGSSWCDVKVYKDHAYIVKDASNPANGIQVFDLTRLDSITGVTPGQSSQKFTADFLYNKHGNSHNVLIDNDSGYLYSVGSNTCRGGLHIASLADPAKPEYVTCVSEDGYTHDAQCVIYDGPDSRYQGREICVAFNEDTLTLWDVTDKFSVEMISRERYDGVQYSHQGWLTEDMKYVLLDDELDETRAKDKRTRTMIVNIEDLQNPIFESRIVHEEESIDHNLYFWGAIHAKGWGGNDAMANPPLSQYAYLSNYAAGLKVVDFSTETRTPKLTGFFDMSPEFDTAEFHGTWSNYMHPSGVVAVSSIERGLFLLRPKMAFQAMEGEEMLTEAMSAGLRIDVPAGETSSSGLEAAVVVLAVVGALAVMSVAAVYKVMKKENVKLQTQLEESRASQNPMTVEKEVQKEGMSHYEL